MIGNNGHRVSHSSKVMPPFFQDMEDCKELSAIDTVVLFSWREHLRVICTGVQISIGISLHQHSSQGSQGGVGHDMEGF